MTKHIIAVIALLASFGANATICNPTCVQPTNNLKPGEKAVDLRLTDASKDTVVTQLRIQAANGTKSTYSDTPVPIGLYQIAINNKVVDAFCVDPFQPASSTDSKYIESKLDWSDFSSYGGKKMWLAQSLYDNAYGSLATATDAVKAGFHIALWEIFYDDLEETTGNIRESLTTKTTTTKGKWVLKNGKIVWEKGQTITTTTSNTDQEVLKSADAFLTALTDNSWKITNKYDLTFYKSVCNQDFLVAKLNPPSQIPVPAALPLFISGLVGFGLMRRRKSA
jgi:hypothetical protein